MSRLATTILAAWVVLALVPMLIPLAGNQIALGSMFVPPLQQGYLLGSDELGRSLGLRLVDGAGVSLLVALVSVAISAVAGTLLGTLAGYFGGWVDRIVSRVIEVFLAFPGLLLAIAMAGMLGPGIENVVIALSVMGWVGYARLARNQVLSLKQREHVSAAIALGQPDITVMRRHLLPLLLAPLLVEASFGIASAVIAEAGLSFLGLGVQPPQASWGSMIREGVRYLLIAPHMVLVPGLALSLVVLAANLLGDALRDRLDVTALSRPAR
jgi:peptide/nickel transport system permease protein